MILDLLEMGVLLDNWLILQLGIDLLLFFLLVVLIFKDSKSRAPNAEELRELINELKNSYEKSEALAKKIEDELKDASNAIAVQDLVRRQKATAAKNNDERSVRALEELEESLIEKPKIPKSIAEKKKYVKALHNKGVSKNEISKRLSISVSEVDLIVAMLDSGE